MVRTSVVAPGRPPILADVARLAGVSSQTVSRVVNGATSISPDTRARVEQAIERLGYRPNRAARALVRGRTGIIGVITTGSGYFGPSTIQRSIEDAARADGLFASSVSLSTVTPATLEVSVEHLVRLAVEGIIVIAGQDDAVEVARQRAVDVPVVLVEGDLTRAQWTVGVDQIAGARAAVRHLLDLGHREIVHIAGPDDWSEARARRDGWRAEMTAAGRRPLEPLSGDWTSASGYAAGRAVLESGATAVFCANDQMAMGLLSALHDAGRRVPTDLSVVGFDDIPETPYLIPPLTSVRQDFIGVGQRAVAMLRAAIEGLPPVSTELVQPQLVIRASTAPRRT